jgi:hypothetical protein
MVHGISRHQVAIPTILATRTSSAGARATAPFSISSEPAQTVAATPARTVADQAPASLTPAPQRQANSAASDFRQLFSGLPAPNPPADATPPAPPFVPAFQTATGTDGTNQWNLNHDYFATKETAQWIAIKYGTGQIVETPFEGSGGPFSASATEYQIKLSDGRMVNAGILAGYYERNPESQFPGLADKLIRSQLGLG